MSFCGNCGNKITNEAVGCTYCNQTTAKGVVDTPATNFNYMSPINQPTKKKSNGPIAVLILIALVIVGMIGIAVVIPIIGSIFGDAATNFSSISPAEKEAIEAAEKRAKQIVYEEKGLVATRFDSEIIYEDGDERLIVVRLGFDLPEDYPTAYPSEYLFSMCVNTKHDIAFNTTTIQNGDFNYEERIEELKALFGI